MATNAAMIALIDPNGMYVGYRSYFVVYFTTKYYNCIGFFCYLGLGFAFFNVTFRETSKVIGVGPAHVPSYPNHRFHLG